MDLYCCGSGGNGVMLIEYKQGSFEAKLGAKRLMLSVLALNAARYARINAIAQNSWSGGKNRL
jgi:hypothetical protein